MLLISKNTDNLLDCTTDKFSGVVAVLDPKESWVAKWQHLQNYAPGMYALTLEGELPQGKVLALERAGRSYIPRDRSFTI